MSYKLGDKVYKFSLNGRVSGDRLYNPSKGLEKVEISSVYCEIWVAVIDSILDKEYDYSDDIKILYKGPCAFLTKDGAQSSKYEYFFSSLLHIQEWLDKQRDGKEKQAIQEALDDFKEEDNE